MFHAGGHDDPERLTANANKSFQGSIVLGMGFTFDDNDAKGVASPIAEMHQLIAKDPRNGERIFPYIGGEEVNDGPTQAHHRYVISFGEMSEEEARRWPDLMRIVEEKVKPERMRQKDEGGREKWWQFLRPRGELQDATRGMERVLVNALYGPYLSLVFLPARQVFTNKLNIMPFDTYAPFAVLQSRAHEVWARAFSSTLKDDLAYAPSDCFETFPFPVGFETNAVLERVGGEYYSFRAALMVRNNEGLTKTYNRFHDPNETSPDILRLRELHAAMDRVMLNVYGWATLKPTCEFLLDYEEEDEHENGTASKKKKPWRYRWPDEFRDEVLARLLELNKQRAEEQGLSGRLSDSGPCAVGQTTHQPRTRKTARGSAPWTLSGDSTSE